MDYLMNDPPLFTSEVKSSNFEHLFFFYLPLTMFLIFQVWKTRRPFSRTCFVTSLQCWSATMDRNTRKSSHRRCVKSDRTWRCIWPTVSRRRWEYKRQSGHKDTVVQVLVNPSNHRRVFFRRPMSNSWEHHSEETGCWLWWAERRRDRNNSTAPSAALIWNYRWAVCLAENFYLIFSGL